MNKKFYITQTLPYVNSEPHIGFALEVIQTDVIARFHRLLGDDVFFNFGTDEHGLKIYRKAIEQNKDPQKYCDEYAAKFTDLKDALDLSYTNFVRTTDPHHLKAAQEFWERCLKNGDIYKKNYKIKYCVGCELERTDSELKDGKCEFHPNLDIENYEEENYFFRFSKYQKPLLEFYKKNPGFVIPQSKFNEIKMFVENGLEDFSVSRLKSKMPWGVDVPNDVNHVMYVWFDALVGYISSIGWPEKKDFGGFWPGVQTAGKDNLRQQTAIWQAMLMSAGLPNSKQVFIHGFITVDGQKISKSLGNVIDPIELTKKYGTEAVRYFLLAKLHPYEDSDFTYERFEKIYNSDLANGLGNLVSRVTKLCELNHFGIDKNREIKNGILKEIGVNLNNFRFDIALDYIWGTIKGLDKYLERERPWQKELSQDNQRLSVNVILDHAVATLIEIAESLKPFLPQTAQKILDQFKGPNIASGEVLFPRIK